MIPIWAIPLVPVIGFVCRSFGGSANQIGFGLVIGASVCYFLEDLLKRKIRLDDDCIFFGFRAIPIKSIQSVDVNYKKGKFLPSALTLTCDNGRKLKLKLSGLSEDGVETLLKHLQSRNSELKTAAVLNTLVKCRSVRRKLPDSGERLEVSYNSRKFFGEAIDVFKSSARNWARVGPVMVCLFMPIWLSFVPSLYVCLHPFSYRQTQNLNLVKFFNDLFGAIVWYIGTQFGHAYESVHAWVVNPVVSVLTFGFIFGFFYYLFRLAMKPNCLVADKKGVALLMRIGELQIPNSRVEWNQIEKLELYKDGSQAGKLRIHKNNKKHFDLDLSAIAAEDRVSLLRRMEKLVPGNQIDHELSQAMLPKSDRSYTEIWLQSLNQSPERKALDPLAPGQYVGDNRFEVLRSIGVGGQGKAYLCRPLEASSEQQDTVVLKETIIPVFADNSVRRKSLETFEQEARLLMSLQHPGVVKLTDYFVEDHRTYLVLEHIDGLNLRDLVSRDGKMTEEQVISLALQMTDILKFLHSNSVVHRDFTPDNLILNSKGQLKLIDFNVAQQVQTGSSGTIVGKHAYLPPEQFRAKACAQSDLYAFGATLYYMLTGSDPEPISQSSPSTQNSDVGEVLNQIVKKATALQLNNRYQSAAEIEIELLALETPVVSNDRIQPQSAEEPVTVLSVRPEKKELEAMIEVPNHG